MSQSSSKMKLQSQTKTTTANSGIMEEILRRQAEVNVLRPARDRSDWVFYSVITGRTAREIQTELFAG